MSTILDRLLAHLPADVAEKIDVHSITFCHDGRFMFEERMNRVPYVGEVIKVGWRVVRVNHYANGICIDVEPRRGLF